MISIPPTIALRRVDRKKREELTNVVLTSHGYNSGLTMLAVLLLHLRQELAMQTLPG